MLSGGTGTCTVHVIKTFIIHDMYMYFYMYKYIYTYMYTYIYMFLMVYT